MKRLLLAFIIPFSAHAFTLNNSIGARFKEDKVAVKVASNTNCNTAGTSVTELKEMIEPAINEFWNKVPSSRLKLTDGGVFETTADFQTTVLCLQGGSCSGTAVPAVTDIIVACNDSTNNFSSGSSLLALTLPTVISGRNIKGSVMLINNTNNSFGQLSKNQKIAVIAHEIGHAIGLGHSDERQALMYYSVVPKRTSVGQDDIDGVTYLYPVQLDMFGAGCFLNTVSIVSSMKGDDDHRDPPEGGGGTFWPTALLGLLVALWMKRPRRENAASFHA